MHLRGNEQTTLHTAEQRGWLEVGVGAPQPPSKRRVWVVIAGSVSGLLLRKSITPQVEFIGQQELLPKEPNNYIKRHIVSNCKGLLKIYAVRVETLFELGAK